MNHGLHLSRMLPPAVILAGALPLTYGKSLLGSTRMAYLTLSAAPCPLMLNDSQSTGTVLPRMALEADHQTPSMPLGPECELKNTKLLYSSSMGHSMTDMINVAGLFPHFL